jgi:methylated-DNA-[protein]-cysteine S-methyltransferase
MLGHPNLMFIDRVEGPLGTMIVVQDTEERLRALDFHDFEPRMRRLLRLHYGTESADFILQERKTTPAIGRALEAYFAGDLTAIDTLAVKTGGTSFQQSVWKALRAITPGTTLSYGELARRLGRPTSARAVGLANGANPVAIVVPCHRLIGADASLTGYGGGIDRKRWLLAHESAFRSKSDSIASSRPARTLAHRKAVIER